MLGLTTQQLIAYSCWWGFIGVVFGYFIAKSISYGWYKGKLSAITEEAKRLLIRNNNSKGKNDGAETQEKK